MNSSSSIIILIIILGSALGIFLFFIIKSFVKPHQVQNIANLIKQGKSQMATRAAKAVLAKDSRNCDAHYFLGQAYKLEGKDELALMEFKTVNNLSNFNERVNEITFRKEIAELYLRFHQPEEALKEYLLLINKEPHEAEHYYMIGSLLEVRKRHSQAINYYKKALENDPRHSDSYYRLGVLLYNAKKGGDAKIYLSKALKFQSDNYKAYYYIGKIQKESKEFIAAIESFDKAQKEPELKLKSLIESGSCEISIKNYDGGSTTLERAIKLAEKDGSTGNDILFARYFLAFCYEKNRQLEKAITQWEAIFTANSTFKDVAEKLSQYQELRSDDSMKDYMTASNEEFEEFCRGLCSLMKHSANNITMLPNGCKIIAIENTGSQWRNTRKFPKLFIFLRVPENIDAKQVREIYEEMQQNNISRGLIFSSSEFTRTALEYMESRPLELFGKSKLQELLHKLSKKK